MFVYTPTNVEYLHSIHAEICVVQNIITTDIPQTHVQKVKKISYNTNNLHRDYYIRFFL